MKELGFKVTVDEANLILEGLGHLPFARVYQLVEKLQGQASQQIKGLSQPEPGLVPEFSSPRVADGKDASNGH